MTHLKASHFNWVQLVKSSSMPTNSKCICFYLSTFMNAEQDMAWPSLRRMEHELGMTRPTLVKYLNIAQEHGYLAKSLSASNAGTNIYAAIIPKPIRDAVGIGNQLPESMEVGGKPDLPGVVKDVYQGGKGRLPGVVKDVYPNKQVNKQEKHMGGNRKRFSPPTLDEVRAYAKERGSSVDPQKFHDYYEAGDWKDQSGKPVKNWKQKLITWERKETTKQPQFNPFEGALYEGHP